MRALLAALLVAVVVAACGETPPTSSPTASSLAVVAAADLATAPPTASPTPAPTPIATPTPTPVPTPTATATTTTTTDEQAAPPVPTAKVTATKKTRYFKVYGTSPGKLLDSTVARSERVCGSADTLACVRQSRDIEWTMSAAASSTTCRITSVAVRLKSTVWLPRWVKSSSAPDGLTAWWRAMVKHFTWHEGQHISIEKKYDKKLGTLLVGKACKSANKILRKWAKSVDKAQAKFDAKDASWPYPVYRP
jgi:predicted secreted Zn-dependent protease